jgi:hypothetical protein
MRVVTLLVLGTTIAVLHLAGCGDVYADPSSPSQPVDVPMVDGSAVFPQDVPSDCPSQRPSENTFCNVPGSTCEYGSSADMSCNVTLACATDTTFGSSWIRRPHDSCASNLCPTGDVASLDGKPCTLVPDGGLEPDAEAPTDADERMCGMSDGICTCTTGRDAAHAHARMWICVKPIQTCPARRPLAGERCTGSAWCDYGSCKFKRGLAMQCQNGAWVTGGATCN